jgi:ribonuclease J
MWKDCNLKVFFPRKKDGSYDPSNYYVWERDYLDRMVTVEDLRENQVNYLWCLELNKFPELISVRPLPDSAYIYSLNEFRSEEDPGEKQMEEAMWKWVKHFGLTRYQIHASGHAPESEIRQMVERIQPKYLIPVHTEHPEAFQGWGPVVKIPELGKPIPLD